MNNLKETVVKMLDKNRTVNDIVTLLFMNDEYPTKAEARIAVTKLMEDEGLSAEKPKPMSVQLKKWYMAQGQDALELTKKDIEKQVLAIGMSGGSVKYYTDMYAAASEIAKQLIK